jgi:N-acetyl-anhydromuramyl-L-alanine amidase AmpD
MRHINKIVIHCSGSPNGRANTPADIERWHLENGWNEIGYHFIITLDGVVHEFGRTLSEIGSHAKGYNKNSIGICLVGTDKFTTLQWNSLKALVLGLKSQFPNSTILGHRDLPNVKKECPGFSVKEWQVEMEPSKDHILTAP